MKAISEGKFVCGCAFADHTHSLFFIERTVKNMYIITYWSNSQPRLMYILYIHLDINQELHTSYHLDINQGPHISS